MRLSVNLDLLDHQVTDAEKLPIARVDDLEISVPEDGSGDEPLVTGLVLGTEAAGHRIGGRVGAVMASASARLRDRAQSGPPIVAVDRVEQVRPFLVLTDAFPDLPQVARLEHWLRRHVVAPDRGGDRADQ
ncbi:MAG: hypothetical protein ACTHKG_19345 [Nocardioides sp.]